MAQRAPNGQRRRLHGNPRTDAVAIAECGSLAGRVGVMYQLIATKP